MALLFPDRIASLALHHYDQVLPSHKGKPKENEWTVYAALIATREVDRDISGHERDEQHLPPDEIDIAADTAWVVCSATGTKCTSQRCQGCVLHDTHAEVLVRRGFQRVIWQQSIALLRSASSQIDFHFPSTDRHRLLDIVDNGGRTQLDSDVPTATPNDHRVTFQLRSGIRLHMYISDSPCGDASIYPIQGHNLGDTTQAETIQFTGAKVIVSDIVGVSISDCGGKERVLVNTPHLTLAREGQVQLLGRLRSKSGRSNLDADRRSHSMSCSDKLVRWGILGLQGQVLSAEFKVQSSIISLASIVVSKDPRARLGDTNEQLNALQRSIPDRIRSVLDACGSSRLFNSVKPPDVYISQHIFRHGKSVSETLRLSPELSVAATVNPLPRKRPRRADPVRSACGVSINWQQSDPIVELVVGARGIRHGPKPQSSADIMHLKSRLCRSALVALAQSKSVVCSRVGDDPAMGDRPYVSYQDWKQWRGCPKYLARKNAMLQQGPLAGWIVGSRDGDFSMDKNHLGTDQ